VLNVVQVGEDEGFVHVKTTGDDVLGVFVRQSVTSIGAMSVSVWCSRVRVRVV